MKKALVITVILCSQAAFAAPGALECSFTNHSTGNNRIYDIAIDNYDHIYAVGPTQKICKSIDGGTTWEYINDETLKYISMIKVDKDNLLYAGADNLYSSAKESTFFKSVDNGKTWMDLSDPKMARLTDIAVSKQGTIFTAGYTDDFYMFGPHISRDAGDTWESIDLDVSINSLLIDLNDNVYVFGSMHKSVDDGVTWAAVPPPWDDAYQTYVSDVDSLNAIYLGAERNFGIYKSVDGGQHWDMIMSGGLGQLDINAIAIDRRVDHIYVSVYKSIPDLHIFEHRLLQSKDKGKTWQETSAPHERVTSIAFDSKGHVYLGLDTRGQPGTGGFFYKSVDQGKTWQRLGFVP